MRKFISIETDRDAVTICIEDIIAVNCFYSSETGGGELDFYLKGSDENLCLYGEYERMEELYKKVTRTLTCGEVIAAGETPDSYESNPPKVAKKLPDLDKCVLLTED